MSVNRRDVLKGLASLPFMGMLGWAYYKKHSIDNEVKNRILEELKIKAKAPSATGSMSGGILRLGIIGPGGRGRDLMRAAGYAEPQWIEEAKKGLEANNNDKRLETFLGQENLNIRFTAVCDVFDIHADRAMAAAKTDDNTPKRYRRYQDLLNDPNVDAVIIATPDHWHAPIAIDAIKAGKHVYVEKCMTHKVKETFLLRDTALQYPGIKFQVGHQHRQTLSFLTAIDIVEKNILGHISLIEASTNRNDDVGAWQYDIHPEATPQTVDWQQFLGDAKNIPFNAEHLFRWRKWWAYGTGLSGDLLTHDFDRINCILNMGIPQSVFASGGIYTHNDGREVPDVMQVAMEYPEFETGSSQEKGKEKGMTFLYSATLGNQFWRPTKLMGHDATLELGNTLTVFPDPNSTRYKELIQAGTISPDTPMYSYDPSVKGVDGVTSATAKYFAQKGLLYTYRDGKAVDSTHLHIREWVSAIRNNTKLSCGINEGFEEAVSAHMATLSLKTGRKVIWDKNAGKIAIPGMDNADLDEIIVQSGQPI
ncbi:MAG: Gfo/Idh/MocA family oxidoreductase [Bacteroidales bacterium]|nr:Gfo/Idh/MocA family oxidoreductase [Bacteroidales bacterium]